MLTMLHTFHLSTARHEEWIVITESVAAAVRKEGVAEGMALIYCPHTTAAITINENADPDVVHDLLARLRQVFPWEDGQDRHREGNSAAHIKASVLGASESVIIAQGQLLLGRWQGIYFCEFDGPRPRTFYVKIMRSL